LNLLEKYDNKLDELQEDNELKDMKIFEYERDTLGDAPKIKIDSIEEKVRFLVHVLHRLKIMYIEGLQELSENSNYPKVSAAELSRLSKLPDESLPIEEACDQIIEEMEVIKENRNIRMKL